MEDFHDIFNVFEKWIGIHSNYHGSLSKSGVAFRWVPKKIKVLSILSGSNDYNLALTR